MSVYLGTQSRVHPTLSMVQGTLINPLLKNRALNWTSTDVSWGFYLPPKTYVLLEKPIWKHPLSIPMMTSPRREISRSRHNYEKSQAVTFPGNYANDFSNFLHCGVIKLSNSDTCSVTTVQGGLLPQNSQNDGLHPQEAVHAGRSGSLLSCPHPFT